ncbi:hypothetical protein MUB24_21665 [Lederbergia sp. NSJ-179]|uniref:hypothetical protein n=1 Tax=Lederbergia sp. NSJ-179 TaxID=2931402 RepID=UPI001FD5219F|nr:hypothetical protein [Lederbergia sp. NSJ-179]MCJ7843434.1 hypothetical protein [Lederbergia sp. NSJ-179]
MHPSHMHLNYYHPHIQEADLYSTPYQGEYDDQSTNERQFGGFPPLFPPPGQGPEIGAPTAPPPSFVPSQAATFAVDPGSIRRCLFRFTYVWLRGSQQFWFYPIFVGRRSISGYRWTGFGWIYFGISLRQIQSFTCI